MAKSWKERAEEAEASLTELRIGTARIEDERVRLRLYLFDTVGALRFYAGREVDGGERAREVLGKVWTGGVY